MALSWRLGHLRGVEEGVAEARREVGERERTRTSETLDRLVESDARVAALEHERDAARATSEALRDQLDRAERLSADERAELELYRRVGGDALPSGLSIESIERPRGPTRSLAVTLVQARGRDRVKGRIDVLPGAPGQAPEPRSSTEERRGVPEGAIASERFDLRFFETVELPLRLAGGAAPEELIISIVPDSGRLEPFRERVEREAIRIAD